MKRRQFCLVGTYVFWRNGLRSNKDFQNPIITTWPNNSRIAKSQKARKRSTPTIWSKFYYVNIDKSFYAVYVIKWYNGCNIWKRKFINFWLLVRCFFRFEYTVAIPASRSDTRVNHIFDIGKLLLRRELYSIKCELCDKVVTSNPANHSVTAHPDLPASQVVLRKRFVFHR